MASTTGGYNDGPAGGGTLLSSALAQGLSLDEPEVDLLRNFGEHSLLQRVQTALQRQLQRKLDTLDAELLQAEEGRDAARIAREGVGVELYGVQQQLARVQVELENSNAQVTALHDIRTKAELELKVFQDGFASRKAAIETEEAKLEKFKGELDGINDTLRQVEAYNAEMAAEVALTKRVASKAEVELAEKERRKGRQDEYINKLLTGIQAAANNISIVEAQVEAQRGEAAAAAATLASASLEYASIAAEKKALMASWTSSVNAMRRRGEALAAVHASIEQQQQNLDSMDAEEANIHKDIFTAQEAHAQLQDQLDREEAQLKVLETQAVALRRQYEGLEEKQASLAGALEGADSEVARLQLQHSKLEKALREVERERYLLDKQRFGIEDEIAELLSTKTTNEKAAKALVKDARQMIGRVHNTELQCADMENDIAAAKLSALDAAAATASLRATMAGLEDELKEKEVLIDRYATEIKQRHDAIEAKMMTVDRLNRKYEKMVADQPEVENMGPLHAEIHNVQRALVTKREECEALQKRWLADQTSLVAAANDAEGKATRLRELQSQVVLLDQKRIRLDGAIAGQTGEAKRLNAAVKVLHEDMTRINALIARNAALGAKLAESTHAAAGSFGEELKAMEKEIAAAEARVVSIKEEKARLLDEILECERQLVLWEKKITLEKETQETLDPTAGESEIASMEKDIHRMRMRYDAVKREQERLVAEMERAIEKREIIAMKNKSANSITLASATATGKAVLGATGLLKTGKATTATATKIGLRQKAAQLRQEIEARLKQIDELEEVLADKQRELDEVLAQVGERTEEVRALESQVANLQKAINALLYDKQKGVETVSALTRLLQRLDALENGRLPALTGEEAAKVVEKLTEAESSRKAVRALIRHLAASHSELSEVLDRVGQLIDIAPEL